MIVDSIITFLQGTIAFFITMLPVGGFGLLTTVYMQITSALYGSAKWLVIMPIHGPLGILQTWLSVVFPVVLSYRLFNWLYKHIPQIGGFGPGSG